jgi:hypothetical protein
MQETCVHLWSKASQVGVLHKASRLRAIVILGEVGQGAAPKPKGDALALHVLLPHTGNHLHVTTHMSGWQDTYPSLCSFNFENTAVLPAQAAQQESMVS